MTVTHVNKASEAFLAALGSGLGLAVPAALEPSLAGTLATNRIISFETEVSGRTFSLSACPVSDRGYVNVYGTDITDRKQAELALVASEERYHSLFSCMLRKIVSLTALTSFLLTIVTSVVLYIAPQGRIAYWSDWHLLGLTKTQWGNLHINLGTLFLIALCVHIYYNWKPITAYLSKARKVVVMVP